MQETVGDIEDAGESVKASCCASVAAARNGLQEEFVGDSFMPGYAKIFIKTWGCSHNNSDSEYMAGILTEAGYEITDNATIADLWLLNSCTVKTPSEDQLKNYVRQAVGDESSRKVPVKHVTCTREPLEVHALTPVVLAGCVPQAAPGASWMHGFSVIGVQQIDTVVDVVEETLKEGVRELWLTSEDLGAYGRDLGVTLPELLNALVDVIPAGCMMRLGMTNPPYILDYLPEIAAILNHERVFAFLHIPVQSGSDAVLKDMKREYTSKHFRTVVDFMRENVPSIHIATDIICAFPTETDDDFDASYALINEYRFHSVFINQFYPRPGTPAAKMTRCCDAQMAKDRTRRLSTLFRSYMPYGGREGREYECLITEWAADNTHLVAHNKSYEQILISSSSGMDTNELLGKWVRVRITNVSKFSMSGDVIDRMSTHMNNANVREPVVLARGQRRIDLPTPHVDTHVDHAIMTKSSLPMKSLEDIYGFKLLSIFIGPVLAMIFWYMFL